jgi:hypothetical protein
LVAVVRLGLPSRLLQKIREDQLLLVVMLVALEPAAN